MIKKIADKVWKLNVDSNIYFLDLDEKTIIDTGPRQYREDVISELDKVVDFGKVDKVIFTHLHYDHIGNFDLFPKARYFASAAEIEDFNKHPLGATGLNPLLLAKFKKINLEPINDTDNIKVIRSPGHTRGSICLFYSPEKILFSGDTLFKDGYGRVDLPTSDSASMKSSLKKVKDIDYKILAPGHDY